MDSHDKWKLSWRMRHCLDEFKSMIFHLSRFGINDIDLICSSNMITTSMLADGKLLKIKLNEYEFDDYYCPNEFKFKLHLGLLREMLNDISSDSMFVVKSDGIELECSLSTCVDRYLQESYYSFPLEEIDKKRYDVFINDISSGCSFTVKEPDRIELRSCLTRFNCDSPCEMWISNECIKFIQKTNITKSATLGCY